MGGGQRVCCGRQWGHPGMRAGTDVKWVERVMPMVRGRECRCLGMQLSLLPERPHASGAGRTSLSPTAAVMFGYATPTAQPCAPPMTIFLPCARVAQNASSTRATDRALWPAIVSGVAVCRSARLVVSL